MKGALVTFIAKVEGVVKETFYGLRPRPRHFLPPPPIKIPGGATEYATPKTYVLHVTGHGGCAWK